MSLNFSVETVKGENQKTKTEAANKVEDTRSLVDRNFTIHNDQTGEVTPMPVQPYNCATQTVSAQGYSPWDMANQIPLFLGYKAAVPDFKGPTKGRDFVVIGKRPGNPKNGGNPGLMIDVKELGQFIERLQELHDALNAEKVNALRTSVGLPAHPIPEAEAQVPPTEEA